METPLPADRWRRRSAYAGVLAASAVSVLLIVLSTVPDWSWVILGIVGLTVATGATIPRLGRRAERLAWTLFAAGAVFAVVSVVTGWLNGLSDEPYTTPAYAGLGLAMYTHPISIAYVQYGVAHAESSYDVYLPLLTYAQVPGLDYRWVSLAAWAGMVYWRRHNARDVAMLSVGWIPLLAANGQNDFVPLFALTVALSGRAPGRWRWTELPALGLKQLANVLVFAYHLARREYAMAAASVAITVAVLVPFLILDPTSVYCHVLLADPGSTCTPRGTGFFLFKRNYWLYPTWAIAVFYTPLALGLRRLFGRSRD